MSKTVSIQPCAICGGGLYHQVSCPNAEFVRPTFTESDLCEVARRALSYEFSVCQMSAKWEDERVEQVVREFLAEREGK